MTRNSILWGVGLLAGGIALALLGRKAITVVEEAMDDFDDSIDISYATLHSWVWN
jgi:hypothetical protein